MRQNAYFKHCPKERLILSTLGRNYVDISAQVNLTVVDKSGKKYAVRYSHIHIRTCHFSSFLSFEINKNSIVLIINEDEYPYLEWGLFDVFGFLAFVESSIKHYNPSSKIF
jgi:hypothetical protein